MNHSNCQQTSKYPIKCELHKSSNKWICIIQLEQCPQSHWKKIWTFKPHCNYNLTISPYQQMERQNQKKKRRWITVHLGANLSRNPTEGGSLYTLRDILKIDSYVNLEEGYCQTVNHCYINPCVSYICKLKYHICINHISTHNWGHHEFY